MAINVYEQAQDLYNEFKPGTFVRLQYKPTERSRKWRNTSLAMHYSFSECCTVENRLKAQENWHATQWVEVCKSC